MSGVKKPTRKIKPSTDPHLQFLQITKNFPIELFDIPRPLKSRIWNEEDISDHNCVEIAFTLLGITPDMDYELENPKKPLGWLNISHLWDIGWQTCISSYPLRDYLQTNPWLLVKDSCVQLAVAILRTQCEIGLPKEAKVAKEILKELKLNFLIPAIAKERRTDNPFLRYCDTHPVYLVSAVRLYEFVIKKFQLNHQDDLKELLISSYEFIFNEVMKGTLLDSIIHPNEDKPDNYSPLEFIVALILISHETGCSYEALKSHYYDLRQGVSYNEVIEYIDKITDNSREKRKIIKEFKITLRSK